MKDNINNLKKTDTWKTQLPIKINIISSKDIDEERVMDSKSDNTEIMICNEVDKVIKEDFELLLYRNQIRLETSVKGSDFIFDCINL